MSSTFLLQIMSFLSIENLTGFVLCRGGINSGLRNLKGNKNSITSGYIDGSIRIVRIPIQVSFGVSSDTVFIPPFLNRALFGHVLLLIEIITVGQTTNQAQEAQKLTPLKEVT